MSQKIIKTIESCLRNNTKILRPVLIDCKKRKEYCSGNFLPVHFPLKYLKINRPNTANAQVFNI